MALDRTGVELVVENQGGFASALKAATGQVGGFNSGIDRAVGNVESMNGKTMTLAVAVGNVLANAFQAAASAGMQVANMAVENVKQLQDLEITLTSLVGAEAVQAGMAENVTEAMDMVGGRVESLFKQIKEISLASPFEYSQIVSVMQMNMAFGQTSDTALKLTKAVTDLASVNKGIPGILQRITYNFSQMNMVGKISMRDFRDLAMAGVDLGKVLKQGLGMSMEETNKALETGKITMQDVTNAFVEYVDKNFAGAAQRASRSLGGLVSSFKDLGFFASQDLFKPALDRITAALAGLLDKAIEFVASGKLQSIGYTLDWMVEKAIGWAGNMIKAAKDFFTGFGGQMDETARNAFDWGINIIAQLAGGIAEATATVLTAAMNVVGSILAFFLAPGSPPRVAPDIDKWGAAAMSEYLMGFTKADYSILDAIQGPLKSALDDPAKFAGFSKEIIGLLSTNQGVGSDLYNRLAAAAGTEMANLIKWQVDLANATEAVTAAEKELNDLRKAETDQIEKISEMSEEYNNLVAAGADPAVLKAKRDAIKAEQQSLRDMDKERLQKEKDLQAMKAGLEPLQDQIGMQELMLRQIQELADAEEQARKAQEKGGAGGGKTSGERAAVKTPAFDLSGITDGFDVEGFKKKLDEKFAAAFKPLTDVYEQKIKPAFDKVSTAWQEFAPKIGQAWEQWLKPAFSWIVDNAGAVAGALITWKIGMGALSLLFSGSILSKIQGFAQNFQLLVHVFKIGMPVAGPYLALAAALAALVFVVIKYGPAAWNTLKMLGTIIGLWWQEKVVPAFQAGWQKIVQVWNMFITWIVGVWNGFLTTVSLIWANIALFFTNAWIGIKTKATEIWQGIKDAISGFISNTIADIVGYMDALDPMWREKWQAIKDAVAAKWQEIKDQIAAKWEEIKTGIASAVESVKNGLQTAWETIKSTAETLWESLKSSILRIVINVWESIKGPLETLRTSLATAWEAIKTAASEAWEGLKTVISDALSSLGDVLTEVWDKIVAIGTSIVNGIKEGISSAWTNFKKWIAGLLVKLINIGADAIDSGSPSRLAAKMIGEPIAQGIGVGFESAMQDVEKSMAKRSFNMVTPPMGAAQMRAAQAASVAYTTQYNLTVQSNQNPAVVIQSFETMRALGSV